jgi:transposase
LSDAQLRQLEALLLQGASRHGWPNDLWTAARVTEVIRRHCGVALHPEYVRKLLKRRLGWTSQKPQTKAKERDEDGIRRWIDAEFPRIVREARARQAHLVFLDESCFQLTPTVRRTLAPRGRTPVLPCWDRRDKISAISAITLSPKEYLPGLYFQLLPDQENFHGTEVVAFLQELKRHLRRFTVIWDRSNIHHKSGVVREFLARQPSVVSEDLPGYAPELNPDELVWCWTKYGRLSNYAAPDVGALRQRVQQELGYLRKHPYQLLDFIDHTGLTLDEQEDGELPMVA